MKKLVSIAAASVMMLCMIPVNGSAALGFTLNTGEWLINYTIKEGSNAVITSIEGNGTELVIPETFAGCNVTAIDDYAFFEQTNLVSVTIPNTVEAIGDYAFSGCMSLESIIIPEGVTSLGKGCFMGCVSLEEAEIQGDVTIIPEQCFSFCDALSKFRIPDGTEVIGSEAFLSCPNLRYIRLPGSINGIGTNSMGVYYGRDGEAVAYPDFSIKCRTDSGFIRSYADTKNWECITEGDTNLDGRVDAGDASDVLKEYASVSTGAAPSFAGKVRLSADMNDDNVIDASDASDILKEYARLGTL